MLMEFDFERLRLVVHFAGDGNAFYALALGAYSIGSSKACTIRLEHPAIADIHAILTVDQSGIYVENRASSQRQLYKSGTPIVNKTSLGVGEFVDIGPYRLSLIELTAPCNTAICGDLSPEAREPVEELWRQLQRGLPGYDNILDKLKLVIAPHEARMAREATYLSLKKFGLALVALSLLIIGSALLPSGRPNLAAIFYDLATGGSLIGLLVLISRFQVNFAGRVMMPLLWTLRFFEPPMSDWYELPHVPIVFLDLISAFAIGALLDFGASSDPKRRYREPRRIALILAGVVVIYNAVKESKNLHGWILCFSIAAGISCLLWSWWPGPKIERSSSLDSFDAQMLKLIGIRRWFRFAVGRFTAICLGILPVLLFLYSFQIRDRLKWPAAGAPDSAIQTSGPEPKIWFWKQTGRLLKSADLQKYDLYGFLNKDVPVDLPQKIRELAAELASEPYNRSVYDQIKQLLANYRLTSPKDIERILGSSDLNPGQQSLFYLEENKLRPHGPFRPRGEIFSASDQLSFGFIQFVGYTNEEIESREASSRLRRFTLMIFGFIGLLILWRRGGDWGYAFWLGLWFIGVGTIGAYHYNLFFFPMVNYKIWHWALTSSSANLLLNIFQILDSLILVNILAFLTFIPCAAVWVWVCWPTDSVGRHSYLRFKVSHFAVLLGKIILTVLAMNLLFWGTCAAFQSWNEDLALVLASAVFFTVAFVVGYRLKAREKARSGERLSLLDQGSSLLFLSTQALALLSVSEFADVSTQSTTLKTIGYILLCAMVFIFIILVVRKNFLHLFTIRDASIVVTASIALVLLKGVEATMDIIVDYFTSIAGTPEYGSKALSLSVFVLLVPPIHRQIERLLLHLSLIRFDPKSRARISLRYLDSIEKRVSAALELLIDLQDPRAIRQIRRTLSACGIHNYTLFSRKEKFLFVNSVACGDTNNPNQITISQMLLKFLVKRKDVIDLEQLPYEWDLFFVQFELERLRREIPSKYLIPIKLGKSLRALLIVSNKADERTLAGEQVMEGISDIALVATQLQYRYSSPSITMT